MLTGELDDDTELPTDESPTFGVVDDGRKYPAVTARKRQQQNSRRETVYTVSKNGAYAHLYPEFERNVIEPYQRRKEARKSTVDGGSFCVNTSGTVDGGDDKKNAPSTDAGNRFGFPVNTVDGRFET